MITDAYIEKNGKKISKARLIFVDHSFPTKLCDGCDNPKVCATIQAISTDSSNGDIVIICKNCLQEIIDKF